MAESREERIARLLRSGLDHFGDGNEAQAVEVWREVLELDPENEEARDFLGSASISGPARGPGPGSKGEVLDAEDPVVLEARSLIQADELESALELMQRSSSQGDASLEIESLVDLVRVELVVRYRARLGDLSAIPILQGQPEKLTQSNLPANAGFLLSLLDGATSAEELISLSGMDTFDGLRTLGSLVEAEIVELLA